ncbi:TetR/AcrR family transcriptional regulator [Microlunatus elymi]|uniref:TetR/AcrR family transcriptional regulator n=1 Tax=Microlunatus elymi TaxID=2596828 RepID=A0A516Q2S5_9ACTN|nr:TetR/AcrR family transcriptional regulator [Microlunatus elymi]QDP97729.1 TetR/AcrR family transcriptional regulator [Microlunatus elymi]QDP97999.1 TetR/AcrR family transcriptional regulator [Microlunatus elymi]
MNVAGPGPRERLLEAAERLTYTAGANVGVGALLKEANVARRSLYQHFGGKDALIAELLRDTARKDLDAYRSAMESAGDDPQARVLAIFDYLDEVVSSPGFRGCRYLGTDLALAGPDHPAHRVTRDYRRGLHDLVQHEMQRLAHPDPADAAEQILLLIEGTLATGATRPTARPAQTARRITNTLLDK